MSDVTIDLDETERPEPTPERAAREDVPALVAEVRRLREALADLVGNVGHSMVTESGVHYWEADERPAEWCPLCAAQRALDASPIDSLA